jgi:hypothetical protein
MAAARADAARVSRQAHITAGPPEAASSRGPSVVRYDRLEVVTPPLHVSQELGERVPADHMGAALGPLAIPDRGNTAKVCCDLDAASVM